MNLGAVYSKPGPYYSGTQPLTARFIGSVLRHRGAYAGDGYTSGESPEGLVRINNAPSILRVVLFDQVSRLPVADTWSNLDGTYYIGGLLRLDRCGNPVYYYSIAFDYTPTGYIAAIQDWITLKNM